MATKEELLKRRKKNIENLKKKNKENLLVRSIKSPFRGAGHILRTAASTANMPIKGARNLLSIPVKTAKLGGKLGYGAMDKAIKGTKGIIRGANEQGKKDKERRKKLGIGEFAKKPGSKKTTQTKTKSTPKNKNKLTFMQGVKASESTNKGSTTKSKPKDDGGKAAWLKKTRNSPAAKSGSFTDDERWALQQKHRKWKSDRKAKGEAKKHANKGSGRKGKPGTGTYGKSLPSNPQLKTQTTKDKRDPNRHSIKIDKDKKKKNVPLGTRLSKMFD